MDFDGASLPLEVHDAPKPLSWDDYVPLVLEQWRSLLSAPDVDEPQVLAFLAEHPALVPGAGGFEGGHHGPIHSVLFVEPRLPGIRTRQPDFMWIVRDTEAVRPILIEIESPKKRWFKKNGLATDDLQHAVRQLSQWREFFASEANVLQFRTMYELNGSWFRHRVLKPSYCLVYGRTDEFAGRNELVSTRRGMRPDNTEWMTFDSLRPDEYAHDVFSVTAHVDERWDALHAAPTLRFGHEEAEDFARLSGREAAIERNNYMDAERKQFLVQRLPVWDEWKDRERNQPYAPRSE